MVIPVPQRFGTREKPHPRTTRYWVATPARLSSSRQAGRLIRRMEHSLFEVELQLQRSWLSWPKQLSPDWQQPPPAQLAPIPPQESGSTSAASAGRLMGSLALVPAGW